MTLAYLRLLFALQVVDIHSRFFQHIFNHYIYPHIHLPFLWLGDGHLAVEGFFIMSGYLVALISQSNKNLFHFTFTRYARIYPLYWLVLAFYLLVYSYFHLFGSYKLPHISPFILILNLTLIPAIINFFDINQTNIFWKLYIVPSWSLTFDVILYPFGFILSKYPILGLPIILSSIPLFVYLFKYHQPHIAFQSSQHTFFFDFLYSLPAFIFIPFFLGILLFKLKDYIPIKKPLFIGAFLLYLYLSYFPLYLPSMFIGYLLSLLSLSYMIVYVASFGKSKYESLISNYTYSLYLIHYPIIIYFFHHKPIGILLSLLVALIFLIPETIFERLRHKLKKPSTETSPNILIAVGIVFVIIFTFSNLLFSSIMPVYLSWYQNHYQIQLQRALLKAF